MNSRIKVIITIAIIILLVAVGFVALLYQKNIIENKISENSEKSDFFVTPIEDKCISENSVIKENPTFNDISIAGCGDGNAYIGKQVQWKAMVSDYAHTSGIRFRVIDEQHPSGDSPKHGYFWGIFLASPKNDPRETETGLKQWEENWDSNWVNYIMDVYGNIRERSGGETFLVTATIDNVDCGKEMDGCYIETTVKKIKLKN